MYRRMSLLEFQEWFSSEEQCVQYLLEKRWPDGFICPRCQATEYYRHGPRQLFECKACRYQVSVTAWNYLPYDVCPTSWVDGVVMLSL